MVPVEHANEIAAAIMAEFKPEPDHDEPLLGTHTDLFRHTISILSRIHGIPIAMASSIVLEVQRRKQ